MTDPSGRSHTMSGTGSPSARRTGRPSKNRLRRNVGWSARSFASAAVNSMSGWSARFQSIQLSSESCA